MTITRAENQNIVFSHTGVVQVLATCDSANTFVITPGAGVQGPAEVLDVEIQAIECSHTLQGDT